MISGFANLSEIISSGSISVSQSFSGDEDIATYTPSEFEISEITVNGKVIKFKQSFIFKILYDDLISGNFYVEDNFIYIHESDSDIKKLKDKVLEDLEIQWEDIAIAPDEELNEDARELKKFLLSLV